MVLILRFLLCVWMAALAGTLVFAAESSQDRSLLNQLTDAPKVGAVSLSSDGHYLAALRRGDAGESHIIVWRAAGAIEDGETLPYSRADLNWLAWVGGGRLLLSLQENGLVLYDAHIGRLRPLIDGEGPKPDELPPVLLSAIPDDPENILMQWEDPGVPGYPAVYRVNALTGISEKILGAWRPIIRWWASPAGAIELGEAFKGRKHQLFARRADGSWDKISNHDYLRGDPIAVITIEAGGATAAVISGHDSDTRALWRIDTRTGAFIKKLASTKRFDIDAAIIDPVTHFVVGATYVANSAERIIWQKALREQLDAVAAQAGVAKVELVTESWDERVRLYKSRANWRPNRHFLVDEERGTFEEVGVDAEMAHLPRPHYRGVYIPLKGRRTKGMPPMHAVLATPENGPTGRAVVLVHGGPVRRVSERFNAMVSWLTGHGYTVLQPNFRGSSGFGDKWRTAGYAHWGSDMQEDIRTSAEWLIESGYTKRGDMCVMGGSYGGYAAMMSAIRDDDLFACAISLNGVTSVYHLVEYLELRRFYLLSVPRIKGNLSNRSLKRRSPLFRADLIRLPVLLLHATNDRNVPFSQGASMAKALRAQNKEHEFIVLEGAEHQLVRASERRIYFQSALNYLERHIGSGRVNASRRRVLEASD
jgi:dienelactone hydrolase